MYSTTEAKQAGQNLKEDARERMEETRDDLRDIANQAGRKVRSLFEGASDDISEVTDNVATQIRSKPVQSALIALGAGLVLGALFRR